MSFTDRFNEFIKKIKIKHVLFGAMCTLLVLVIVLGCIVGSKFGRMIDALSGTPSTESTEPSDSIETTQAPSQSEQTQPETQTRPTVTEPPQTTLPENPDHVHEFKLTETVTATCENYGYNIYSCSCGKQDIPLDEQVEPYGHSYSAGKVIEASCTTDGCTQYVCSRCDHVDERNKVTALGHDFAAAETVAATCIDDGYTLYRCSHCNLEEKRDVVLALNHDYEIIEHHDVTCTTDEYTVQKCKTCQEVNKITGQASKGHVWCDWSQVTDSSWTRTCSTCAETESSADLKITNVQVSGDYVHDAAGNKYKLYVICVGTAADPDMYHYTINDYLNNGTLAYSYDARQGLIVTYTTNAGEAASITLPVLQSVPATIENDPVSTEPTATESAATEPLQ